MTHPHRGLFSLLLLLLAASVGMNAQAPALADVLQRASDYVREWVPQLANVVATETFEERRLPDRRLLKSDLLLVHYPDGPGWMMFRDVAEADRRRLSPAPDRLLKLFAEKTADAREQALRISAEGLRYHLPGATASATNPFLGMALVQGGFQPRLQFLLGSPEPSLGAHVQALHFAEREQTATGESLPLLLPDAGRVSGTIWLDVETGQIMKTEARMSNRSVSTSTTIFARDQRLGIMLPLEMRTTWGLGIEGVAKYSNYRRFGVQTSEPELGPVQK